MIFKFFYKREVRTENSDHSHWYASYEPKAEKQKY